MDHGAFAMTGVSVDSFPQHVASSQTNNVLAGNTYSRLTRETEPAARTDAPLSLVTSPVVVPSSSSEQVKTVCASVSTVSGLVSGTQHRIASVSSLSSQPSKTIVVMPVSAAGVIAAGQQIVKRVKTE